MTPERRRLVALAAALSPGRAPALLSRLGAGEGAAASALAVALATSPRRTRLLALAAALATGPHLAAPAGAGGHPALARLRREAAASGGAAEAEGRTAVRVAAARGARDGVGPA